MVNATSFGRNFFKLVDSHSMKAIKNDCHLKYCNATVQIQVIGVKAMEALDIVLNGN